MRVFTTAVRVIGLLIILLKMNGMGLCGAAMQPSVPRMTQKTWNRFLTLAENVFRINETIEVLPKKQGPAIYFKVNSIQPIILQKCSHWLEKNPNCPSKGSIHFRCTFVSRHIQAEMFQYTPIKIGRYRMEVEHKEAIRYRSLEGHLTGAMVQCCVSMWRQEPLVFPYLFKVNMDKALRVNVTRISELQFPPMNSPEKEMPGLLREMLNSYFRIYLTEYLYAPPC